jgi:hypothetical protein
MFVLSSSKKAGGYSIPYSLRFRGASTATLSRTTVAPTSTQKGTIALCVKRGQTGSTNPMHLYASQLNSAPYRDSSLMFLANDTLDFNFSYQISVGGGWNQSIQLTSSAAYRDTSAHYYIVIAWDTTQATASNRAKMYVNGVQITSLTNATYPALNENLVIDTSGFTTTIGDTLGKGVFTQGTPFDGLISEFYRIDGQMLDPSYFGQFDSNNVWTPKAYTAGAYGNNGFYLKFNDGSSLTNLCLDRSGNSNNFTATNVSLTAGSSYDWLTDTPTNNYSVLTPLDQVSTTLADANLSLTLGAGSTSVVSSSVGIQAGKKYVEFTYGVGTSNIILIGVTPADQFSALFTAIGVGYYGYNGNKYVSGVSSAYGATFTTGDVIGIALDADSGTVTFYKNNVSQGLITLPVSSSGWRFSFQNGTGSGTQVGYVNFGQRPFTYTPPTGFTSLCTANLPSATVPNGRKYFDVVTYVANASTQSITSLQFLLDFLWIKSRSGAYSNVLQDSVRGPTNNLFSNLTNAEFTSPDRVLAFLSNGWSMGADAAYGVNAPSGATQVGSAWKGGGTAVTNNAGSISSQVSANVAAGFSVLTYIGNGVNATVGHGMGVTPKLVIIKARGTPNGAARDWPVWHGAFSSNEYAYLNQASTKSSASGSLYWNSAVPTSSVISIGTDPSVNWSAATYVAYCFAEVPGYSKIGIYSANGSTNGPFVYCGFRPRWVMIKSATGTAGDWEIHDTARDPGNQVINRLWANSSNAESSSANYLDIMSNGFKLRTSDTNTNTVGATYIYVAFAENPFGGSNVAPVPAR